VLSCAHGSLHTPGRYEGKAASRRKKLGSETYEEKVLPVECVEEYFLHFGVLELDFTFYRPLLDEGDAPTGAFRTLEAYRRHLKEGDRVLLKVPQRIFARHLFLGGTYTANESYLDAGLFTDRFYRPAVDLLGDRLAGFIFEQEYQRAGERLDTGRMGEDLDRFFERLPSDSRYHVELRTEVYLAAPVFEVFQRRGIGQVLSHWTWLPALRVQFARGGENVYSADRRCVIRLLTPRNMRYEEAYRRAFPFQRMVEGMMSPGMVEETVHVTRKVLAKGGAVSVIVNNRAGGNAPLIAREIAGALA
jgi:uncharacterized protein YecE (DUF72 family)